MRQTPEDFIPYPLWYRRNDLKRPVTILEEREIGRGDFGTVQEIIADVSLPDGSISERKLLVVKEYRDPEAARRAQMMYQKIFRDPELRRWTWTTCILADDELSLIMTPAQRQNAYCVAAKPQSEAARELQGLHLNQDQLLAFARQVYLVAHLFAKKHLLLPVDAYLFRISFNGENGPDIQVIIGDFDRVQFKELISGSDAIFRKNQSTATSVINFFFSHYTDLQINDPAVEAIITRARHGG